MECGDELMPELTEMLLPLLNLVNNAYNDNLACTDTWDL